MDDPNLIHVADAEGFEIDLSRAGLERLAQRREFAEAPALAERFDLPREAIEAIQAIHRDASAANTERSYATGKRYWRAWYQLRFGQPLELPLAPACVLRFIVDHALHWPADRPQGDYLLPDEIQQTLFTLGLVKGYGKLTGRGRLVRDEKGRVFECRPWKINTLEQRVSVLSSMHNETRDAGGAPLPNPCRDPYVVRLLRLLRKAHGRHGESENRRDAVTKDELDAMLRQCGGDSARDVRSQAVLLVGFSAGGRRRAEIAGLDHRHLVKRIHEGQPVYLWKLRQTKTSEGELVDVEKPIKGRAAAALKRWIELSDPKGVVHEGPVFREILGANKITERAMSDDAVYRLVISLARRANLAGQWGAHSLRSGFVTQAGRKRVPIDEVMAMTDHANFATIQRYYRSGQALESPASNLADD